MVIHVEIHPSDGKITLSGSDKTTFAIESIFSNDRENIPMIFEAIESRVTGVLGTAFIHLGPEYDNPFRKKIIEAASKFREVKIIDEFSMSFAKVISQASYLPSSGDSIWILHEICPGEEYCDIWQMNKNDAKFVKSFKCNWHNFTEDSFKTIKEQSTVGTNPTAIFCPTTRVADCTRMIELLPHCQTFSYSNKRQNGGIIYCYMNKFINVLPVLDRNISLQFDGAEKLICSKMENLPIKKATLTYGYNSLEIVESADGLSEKRHKDNRTPRRIKSLIFEIDEHGIFSYHYESLTLIISWGKEIDVYDKDTKSTTTIRSDLQIVKSSRNRRRSYPYPQRPQQQQKQFCKEITKVLLIEVTKNYENEHGLVLLSFLPNTTELDHNEYAKLLKEKGISNVCCINMVEALANGIYKKRGRPDIQHYVAAIYHHSYLVLAYFHVEDSKIMVKAALCEQVSENDTTEKFIRWFVSLKFKRNSKIHLSTSNYSHQQELLAEHEISVVRERNIYELIIDGMENLQIELK